MRDKIHYAMLSITIFGIAFIALELGSDENPVFQSNAYALWMPQTPEEVLEESNMIVVGKINEETTVMIESELRGGFGQQMEYGEKVNRTDAMVEEVIQSINRMAADVNGTVKSIERNNEEIDYVISYSYPLEKYTVEVEEIIKDVNSDGKDIPKELELFQPGISGAPGAGPTPINAFDLDDRVLLYVNPRYPEHYEEESFKLPSQCDAEDVLLKERFWFHSGGMYFKQDNVDVSRDDVADHKPLQLDYRIDAKTLDGRSFDISLNITKADISPPTPVFDGVFTTTAQPCEWITTSQMEIDLESGEYFMSYTVLAEEEWQQKTYRNWINVKSNSPSLLNPLKQMENNIPIHDIQCREERVLVIRSNGNPACVTEGTSEKWIERGWAINQMEAAIKECHKLEGWWIDEKEDIPSCMIEPHPVCIDCLNCVDDDELPFCFYPT